MCVPIVTSCVPIVTALVCVECYDARVCRLLRPSLMCAFNQSIVRQITASRGNYSVSRPALPSVAGTRQPRTVVGGEGMSGR